MSITIFAGINNKGIYNLDTLTGNENNFDFFQFPNKKELISYVVLTTEQLTKIMKPSERSIAERYLL